MNIMSPDDILLNTHILVLLVIFVFPIMSLLNNNALRSKPFLWWLRISTKTDKFVKGNNNDEGVDFDCVICLSEVSPGEEYRVLPRCHHKFHAGCIASWFETGRWSCPICRNPSPPAPADGGEGRGGLGCWMFVVLDKLCMRLFGTIRSEIMVALSHEECYFY